MIDKVWKKQDNLDRDSTYTLEEVLPYAVFTIPLPKWKARKRREEPKKRPERLYNSNPVKMDSLRYQTFAKKGTVCAFCSLEGTFFALEKHNKGQKSDRWHLNLYGINEFGQEVLFTKDHIIPTARGGKNCLNNLQPSCYPCNNKKGCGDSPEKGSSNNPPGKRTRKKRLRRLRRKIQKMLEKNKAIRKATYVRNTPDGGPGYMKLVAKKKRLIYRLNSLNRVKHK